MLSESTKPSFSIDTGRYVSFGVMAGGIGQTVVEINYQHDDQELDHIASQIFNQTTNTNHVLLNHFFSLLRPHPYRVDLTIYPDEIGAKETKYLFDFCIHDKEIYRVEITDEDLKSERMLRRTLETILYALLFHLKPTQIIEKEHYRSPEYEKSNDRVQRERGRGRSYDFSRSYNRYELVRGR